MTNPADAGDGPVLLAYEKPENNLYRAKVDKRREGLLTGAYKGATQVKGQYLPNPHYKPCCGGASCKDWGIILLLFTGLYLLMIAIFVGLLSVQLKLRSVSLWYSFAFYLIFLFACKAMIFTGDVERCQRAKEEAKAAEQEGEVV